MIGSTGVVSGQKQTGKGGRNVSKNWHCDLCRT